MPVLRINSPQDLRRRPMLSPLSQRLIARGFLTQGRAQMAEATARRLGIRLHDVLSHSHGLSQLCLAQVMAEIDQTQVIDPSLHPPAAELVSIFGVRDCLRHGILPWRQIGGDTIILSSRPDLLARHAARLTRLFGPIRMAVTTEEQLNRAVVRLSGNHLAKMAESRAEAMFSCRHWNNAAALRMGLACMMVMAALAIQFPRALLAGLTLWTIGVLCLNTVLKICAAAIGWRDAAQPQQSVTPARLPVITMLVPLYNETAIAEHLLARLRALDYPRALLDICLVLETDDITTRATLGRTVLPSWMRAIVVPAGTIKTKPRAMNYALDFARGSIIGVWDAEDAPSPDQLHVVARRFANCPQDVACLQGALDYYNPTANWLTRCFTIEYASWFRVILPGLQKMGLVVPLGGTTLFFRREVLEALGGWDAHNVTEDADLGVRLARKGYRTELIPTVTEEEANGRLWPWVRQRSRWLKGYAITYGVHMRDPIRLWRDLGAWRFFGIQLLFLGTLSQFVLAPVLWSFWIIPFGGHHVLEGLISGWMFWAMTGLFILSELVGLAVAALALRKAGKQRLLPWALTLQLYFPLAAIAAYKGIFELIRKPFYWDKTAHGVLLPRDWSEKTIPLPQPPLHPVSDG